VIEKTEQLDYLVIFRLYCDLWTKVDDSSPVFGVFEAQFLQIFGFKAAKSHLDIT